MKFLGNWYHSVRFYKLIALHPKIKIFYNSIFLLIIPKIFHQIWLGSNSLSLNEQKWRDELLFLHPDWILKCWNEKNIKKLDLFREDIYDWLLNFAEKSDYIRYLCVYHFGWIYLDTDVQFIKNIEPLLTESCWFFIWEELSRKKNEIRLNNGVFWATQKSIVLLRIIEMIHKKLSYANPFQLSSEKIGPGFITPIILWLHQSEIIILPPDYFHPMPWWHERKEEYVKFLTINTYSIHHFSGSWKTNSFYHKIIFFFKKHFYKIKRKMSFLCF